MQELAREFVAAVLVGYATVTVLTVSVGVGVFVGWLAWKTKQNWADSILYGLVAVAASIVIVAYTTNQLSSLISNEKIIRSFLAIPHYKIETLSPAEDEAFKVEVSVANVKMIIFSKKKQQDVVVLTALVVPTPKQKMVYRASNQKDQARFRAQLAIELIRSGNIEYDIDMPNKITLSRYVQFSGSISQHDFLQFSLDMQNAIKLTLAFLALQLSIGQ